VKKVLGIRAEPRAINWAIVGGTQDRPIKVASDTETVPSAFSEAEGLDWVRKKMLFILDHFQPEGVAVRYPEPRALGHSKDAARARCRVEGVALEAAASRGLPCFTATLNTISKNVGESAKDLLDTNSLRGIAWSNYSDHAKEAILVAFSVLGQQ
jgi:Holliday junction resolvasome RuvABC endonuclease subunit